MAVGFFCSLITSHLLSYTTLMSQGAGHQSITGQMLTPRGDLESSFDLNVCFWTDEGNLHIHTGLWTFLF